MAVVVYVFVVLGSDGLIPEAAEGEMAVGFLPQSSESCGQS